MAPSLVSSPHAPIDPPATHLSTQLILVRHGQSEANQEGRFTGTLDPPLTSQGASESLALGALIRSRGWVLAWAFTSVLRRAKDSLNLILSALPNPSSTKIAIIESPLLNERDYGDLNGRIKADVVKEFGQSQTNAWRRGYKSIPPGPNGESLEMTCERVKAYFEGEMKPLLRRGENCLVVTHGNTMRAFVALLEGLHEENDGEGIADLQLGTAAIRTYTFDERGKAVDRELFLGLDGHEGTQY